MHDVYLNQLDYNINAIKDWLLENIGQVNDRYSIKEHVLVYESSNIFNNDFTFQIIIHFKYKNDATLFKLTWC